MKTEKQLNDEILKITMIIKEKYPALSLNIEEMTVTIPDKETPKINSIHLEKYYNSLVSMLENYKINSGMNSKKSISPFLKLILAILFCEGVGIVSGFIANTNMNPWFSTLNKPTWNPPANIFAPVWTTLYLFMGISLWIIWKNKAPEKDKRNQYYLFAIQLFLNFWWSILFFKFHSIAFGLVDILLLLIIILITIISFSHYSKPAAWLLVPYIVWVSFAALLNFAIWNLNR